MAAFVTKSFRFLLLLFKSKDVMMFNGLVALGTVGSQELFSLLAFHCPCTPSKNNEYGWMAIWLPALVLFLISVILNKQTRNLVAECQCHRDKKRSGNKIGLLLMSIILRTAVAPVTWLAISLLQGEAYVCAFSEFVDPSSLTAGDKSFPLSHATWVLARFPCREGPANLSDFQEEVNRRLKYESQRIGWLFILSMASLLFVVKILQYCCSKFGYQEAYLTRYRAKEEQLFRRTAKVHSLAMAANNVKRFFGFVALSRRDKELVAEYPEQGTHLKLQWDNIKGSSLLQEKLDLPPLQPPAQVGQGLSSETGVIEMEMEALLPHPATHLAASQTPDPCSPILPPAPLALGEEGSEVWGAEEKAADPAAPEGQAVDLKKLRLHRQES